MTSDVSRRDHRRPVTLRPVSRDRAAVAAVWVMCLAPLAWITAGANMWIFGKATLVAVAVLLGVLSGVAGGVPRSLLMLGAAGLVVLIVAALATDAPTAALLGRAPRYEGLPMLALYAGALWLGTTLAPGSAAREALPEALASAMLALGVATLMGLMGHNPLGHFVELRDGSLLGNATDQGLVALIGLAVLIGPGASRRDPLLLLGALSGAFVVAASGSRAAMLGAVVAAFVLVALRGRRFALAAVATPMAVAIVAFAIPFIRHRFTDGFSVDARQKIWSMTLRLIADHPVLGVGPNGYMDRIGRYEDLAWAHGAGRHNAILNSPHSWPLQFAAIGGVPGVVLAIALVAVVLRLVRRAASAPSADELTPGLCAAVVAFGCGLLVNFTIVGSTAPAMFLLGVLVAPPLARSRVGLRAAGAVLAAAAVLATAGAAAAEVFVARAYTDLRAGEVTAGARAMRTANRLHPLAPDLDEITALRLTGSSSPAVRDLIRDYAERSLRATPATYRSRLALASVDIAAHRYPEAIARLDALIEDFPARALPYKNRAEAEIGLNLVGRARADLRRAHRIDPNSPRPDELLPFG